MLKSKRRSSALAVAALLASGGLGAAVGAASAGQFQAQAVTAAVPARNTVGAVRGGNLADMVDAVGPAVVQIQTRSNNSGMFGHEGSGGTSGSGFVVDPNGVIVTNNHVVDGGGEVLVKLADGTELAGRVLGTDPKTDLAVLKVETSKPLKAVQWGNSDAARVGEDVFAVGSPFGLGNTVTSGIISARGREIGAGPYDDFLQLDASINSGNSGGPLFDRSGSVVGVNTAILSPSGGNIGIGFAIPSRLAQSIVRQIMNQGEVRRGQISVALQPLTKEIAGQIGLSEAKGALIADVDPAGPAAAAGLRPGDVVVEVAGQRIDDSRQFARAVAEAKIGAELPLEVIREGRKMAASVSVMAQRNG